jgi:hypothetical protein
MYHLSEDHLPATHVSDAPAIALAMEARLWAFLVRNTSAQASSSRYLIQCISASHLSYFENAAHTCLFVVWGEQYTTGGEAWFQIFQRLLVEAEIAIRYSNIQ